MLLIGFRFMVYIFRSQFQGNCGIGGGVVATYTLEVYDMNLNNVYPDQMDGMSEIVAQVN